VRSSTWVDGVDRREERNIHTKIASYLNYNSWYRNTLMAAEIREMNGCWDFDPIREGFYNLLKKKFE
jgi:hypothetical protein